MDSSRWERIQTLFHQAADLPPADRPSFLRSACDGDIDLEAEVLELLREDTAGASLLDLGLAQVAYDLVEDGHSGALPFEEVGPYRILRVLGEGGMGAVYLAERADLGSKVALKLLRDAWLSPARRERFATEQRMLAQLNHPSIARLYDADFLPDGTPFFVMEYVEGLPLTDYCAQHQSSIAQRLQLFRQVCEAVQYAHSQAVIHRDLKPSNILVKTDGTIRLLDFGIAKQLETLDVPAQQTMTGARLMTPAYASPEQIRGQAIGSLTDVYSLGVLLYELLAGRLPFDLSNLSSGEAEIVLLQHDPPKPSIAAKRNSAVTKSPADGLGAASWADLDVLCLTAMHKDPERRYRSVEAFIRDVDHYLTGEPLEARPDTTSYRVSKFIGRNRRAVAATVLVLAVMVGLTIFFIVRLTRARDTALAEAARAQRIQRFMTDLFQGGDETVGPSDDLRVLTLIDRGAHKAHALDADPRAQAELYETLGSFYESLGKFDQAQSMYQDALDERKATFGPESPEVAESLIGLGGLRDDEAKYDESEKLDRQALAIVQQTLPARHPLVAKAVYSLGTTLVNRGQYDQAIPLLNQAAQLQSVDAGASSDLAMSLTELANAHFYRGDYAISDSLNQQVLGIDRKLYGNRHPNVAEDLINLGAIQFQLGHYPEDERYQREALDILQSFYGKDNQEASSVMTALARALIPQGRIDEAGDLLRQSLAIQERVYGPVHPRVAATVGELGKVAQRQGKLDDAEADFRKMADIYRKVYEGKHYYIGTALSNLAGVYMDRKQYKEAERYAREALQMYQQTLAPGHQLIGIASLRLGRALLRQQRFAEAESQSRPGYEILLKQPDAPADWMKNAQTDLAEEYDAMREPELAKKFRAALAEMAGQTTAERTEQSRQ